MPHGMLILGLISMGFCHLQAATPEDILRSAWKDPRIELHAKATRLAEDSFSYNFLEKSDFKFDRGELNQNDIKFGLRFYPKGFTEYKTTLHFQKALEKNEKAAQAAALSTLLAARYHILARVALLKEKKDIATELFKTNRKANRMLSYGAQKDRAELKAYLKNKSDLDKLDIKISDIDRDYKNLQSELADLSVGSIESFNLNDFSSMDDLRQLLEKAVDAKPNTTLSAQLAELDLDKSHAGMAYERAKDEKWFDYLEVSVKEDKINEKFDRVYGLEMSFNLPFLSAPNLSRVDKEAREIHDKVKLISTLESSERFFKNGLIELKTLLDVHKSLRETQARMNLDQMRKASRAIAPQDPNLAIELQRGWYEGREQILDLEFRIRSLFILYLHESSTIAKEPEVNYLSKSMKRIL